MALINCPECDKQVSDSAIACPNCGFAVNSYVKRQQAISDIEKESEKEAVALVEKKMAEKRAAEEKAQQDIIDNKNRSYSEAISLFNKSSVAEVSEAGEIFKRLHGWKDSDDYLARLEERIQAAKKEEENLIEQLAIKREQQKKRSKIIRRIAIVSVSIVLVVSIALYAVVALIIPKSEYNRGIELYNSGNFFEACKTFHKLIDMEGSKEWFAKSEAALSKHNIACDSGDIIAITNEGTLISAVNEDTYYDSTIPLHTVKNASSIAAAGNTVIVLNDYGHLTILGDYYKREFEDLIGIANGGHNLMLLQRDGQVKTMGENIEGQNDVRDWQNVVSVSASQNHTVGLLNDGTVVATGKNTNGQCDVSDWKDIILVSAGLTHTVGVKADGTVVATGKNEDGQCDVSDWKDIVAIETGSNFTIGVKADGTVVGTGMNSNGQCDVSGWKDIVEVATSYNYTAGLTKDGKVISTIPSDDVQNSISKWNNINTVKSPIPDEYESEPIMPTEKPAPTEKPTSKPTEPPTEALRTFEGKLDDIDEDEGLIYKKVLGGNTYLELEVRKNKWFAVAEAQDYGTSGTSKLLLGSDGPMQKDGNHYYYDCVINNQSAHIVLTFDENGVLVEGLDGLNGNIDCNGYYIFDIVIVGGGW